MYCKKYCNCETVTFKTNYLYNSFSFQEEKN